MGALQLDTLNFLVPAYGDTQVLGLNLPNDNGGSYTVDFRSLTQNPNIGGPVFIPQACTIDMSAASAGTSVTFTIPSLNWNAVVFAGTTATFQFPAIQDLIVTLTPSSGTPNIPTFWYNYPALPNVQGTIPSLVTIGSLPAAPQGSPVSLSSVTLTKATAGSTNILVPVSRFILTKLEVMVLPTSTLAVAGINVISILDGATTIWTEDVYVPAAAAPVIGVLRQVLNLDFQPNPYMSLGAGQNLIVNVGTAFTAGGIRVNAFVTG